mmetsp:Transcript_67762/g.167405  ORF Transcript_67762/g.167405 Transcript_67762/m.167405 type:complete len:158 (+) Transcript_67762:185-658(+)
MKFPPRTAACLLLIACAIAQTAQAIATSSGSLAGSLQRMPASNTHFSALPESRGAGAGAPRAVEEGRSGSNVAAAVCGEGLKLRGGGAQRDGDKSHDRTSFSGNYHWIPVARGQGFEHCKSEQIGEDNSKPKRDNRPVPLVRSKSFLGEGLLNPDNK